LLVFDVLNYVSLTAHAMGETEHLAQQETHIKVLITGGAGFIGSALASFGPDRPRRRRARQPERADPR
jgi:hypothetical protein